MFNRQMRHAYSVLLSAENEWCVQQHLVSQQQTTVVVRSLQSLLFIEVGKRKSLIALHCRMTSNIMSRHHNRHASLP